MYKLKNYVNNNLNTKVKLIKHKRSDYLPLMLFTNGLYSSLKKKTNVELLEDFSQIDNYNNIILILYLMDLNKNILDKIKQYNIKTILINTEYYLSIHVYYKLLKLNEENINNIVISEYSPLNCKKYESNMKNINYFYGPSLFTNYLIDFYNENLDKKINILDKEIDIFTFGYINEKRKKLLLELSKKYNVVYISQVSNKELINTIEKSKIILNINKIGFHNVFDYYRNSFLIANKIFFIYEYPLEIDFEIDKNLIGIEENLIVPKYDNIISVIEYYLENYNEELVKNQVEKQYKWFTKFTLDDNIDKYLLNNL